MGVSYETSLKYINMFYGNFQYRRIMVEIGRDDFWYRIDVAFGWIMVATKSNHKPTVVSTSRANWDHAWMIEKYNYKIKESYKNWSSEFTAG